MRVLDAQPQSMAKKKHRKKQKHDNENDNESSDDQIPPDYSQVRDCDHVSKAVNITNVRKALKQVSTTGKCQDCHKDTTVLGEDEVEITIWLCLQCGNQGCDRNSIEKHALVHFEKPHSTNHAIVVNLTSWVVWCYSCDDFIPIEGSSKLSETVDLVRRQSGKTIEKPITGGGSKKKELPELDNKEGEASKKPLVQSKTTMTQLAKVKGLNNLGNTCFFNAVLQSLSQTHALKEVMDRFCRTSLEVILPQSKNDYLLSPKMSNQVPEDAGQEKMQLTPITAVLPNAISLTKAMADFLGKMEDKTGVTFSPNSLFSQVCLKAPRFKGYQQQDSHELLRYLLDGMRAEEHKRYKEGILKAFNFKKSVDPKTVDNDVKSKLKDYSNQSQYTFVDSVFGGKLISTVMCEECSEVSEVYESFLDLSLPIVETKPVRPSLFPNRSNGHISSLKKVSTKEDLDMEAKYSGTNKQSKHQLKIAREKAKKEAKRKKKQPSKLDLFKDSNPKGNHRSREGANSPSAKDQETVGGGQANGVQRGAADDEAVEAVADGVAGLKVGEGSGATAGEQVDLEDITLDLRPANDQGSSAAEDGLEAEESGGSGAPAGPATVVPLCSPDPDDPDDRYDDDVEDGGNMGGSESENESEAEPDSKPPPHSGQGVKKGAGGVVTPLAPRYQPGGQECSLLSCLAQFTAPELLTASNKFGCENCTKTHRRDGKETKTVYTNARKQLLVHYPPPVLTLHLKRFQQTGFSLRKVSRIIEFPRLLDLAPFCSTACKVIADSQNRVLYSLYGVVEHSGQLSGGHYTAYVKVRRKSAHLLRFVCQKLLRKFGRKENGAAVEREKGGENEDSSDEAGVGGWTDDNGLSADTAWLDKELSDSGRWCYVSDTHVSEVPESKVLKAQAYLLFYERLV